MSICLTKSKLIMIGVISIWLNFGGYYDTQSHNLETAKADIYFTKIDNKYKKCTYSSVGRANGC